MFCVLRVGVCVLCFRCVVCCVLFCVGCLLVFGVCCLLIVVC